MEHRKALRSLSKEEGLLKEMQFSRPFFQAMRSWNYEQDHILEIKMEVLTGDPDAEFRRVLRHLGLYPERGTQTQTSLLHQGRQWANRLTYKLHHELPLPLPRGVTRESSVHRDILASIIDQHRFEKITGGRSKGDEDPESHLRKGEPGDWKRHFTDRVAQAFEKTYGDLVTQLGY
jgi:hypothetical protein